MQDYQQPGDWSTSLCGCFDNSCICCCALVLPCVVLAQNVHNMQRLTIPNIPIVDDCLCCGATAENKPFIAGLLYFGGNAASFLGGALSSYNPYFSSLSALEWGSICLHARIRGAIETNIFRREESCCTNFCCACCCYSCALAQEARELNKALALSGYDDQQTTPMLFASTQNSMNQNAPQVII